MRSVRAIVIAVTVLLATVPAVAQTPGAHITGHVTDETGAELPGVSITVSAGTVDYKAITDDHGRFEIGRLPPGTSKLVAALPGFKSAIRHIAITTPDSQIEVPLVLEPGDICIADSVDLGFVHAAVEAAAILEVRVLSVEETTHRVRCSRDAFTYTATVIQVVKGGSGNAVPLTIQWVQDALYDHSDALGRDYLAFLNWDSAQQRYTADIGEYVFPVRDGFVELHRDDVPALAQSASVDDVVAAINVILDGRHESP